MMKRSQQKQKIALYTLLSAALFIDRATEFEWIQYFVT